MTAKFIVTKMQQYFTCNPFFPSFQTVWPEVFIKVNRFLFISISLAEQKFSGGIIDKRYVPGNFKNHISNIPSISSKQKMEHWVLHISSCLLHLFQRLYPVYQKL